MRKGLMLATLAFITGECLAQSPVKGKIAITILNKENKPLEGATVELLRATDSALVKTAITDSHGLAEFEPKAGNYLMRSSYTGLQQQYTSPVSFSGDTIISVGPLAMQFKASTQLQAVTVSTRKPFIQKLSDRIVVNVDNSIVNVGSSAMDVLERSPGVSVDQNDVIGLRGRQGVIIMIDGKPSPMTGSDLANYLKGLPSSAIESIHIITNPSAKYDAAGNSGIIDIHMKKDQRMGSNGTLTLGYGQGVYPKANAGTTLNYRTKKINIFGNYNYAYRKGLNHLVLNRNFFTNGKFIGSDDKDNYTVFPFNTHTARFGFDLFPTKKTIIGFVVNSSFTHFQRENDNHSVVNDENNQPLFRFQTYATNNDHNNNAVANLNLKHTFDSTGKELTADVDYGIYKSASLTSTATSFYNLDGTVKQNPDILDGDQNGKITLTTGKADYVNPLKGDARLEAGFKVSFVSADNDAKFYNVVGSEKSIDLGKTNHFFYNENNNAAYLNFRKEWKKYNVQFGLRTEQTNINTRQVTNNVRFDSSYIQFFPSAFFNYKLSEEKTIGLSVSRRIDRPGYASLNPFLFQIDATTYNTGNPHLLSQFTWSYELSYTLKNLNFTLGYSHTKDVQNIVIAKINDVLPSYPTNGENITIQIPVNLTSQDYLGLTVAAPVRLTEWWNSINNIDVYYNQFNGNLGGSALNNGTPSADISTNNTFTFKKGLTSELNATFNSGGQYGYMVAKPQWALSTGVQKTILKGKGTIRLNITDIFWTNLPKATITYQGKYVENWHASRETRVANIGFTYRFGNNKVQGARRRTTASEEERQRAGGI